MSLTRFLGDIAAALLAESIPFMLTGSLASAAHGFARATMGLDLVIAPTPPALDQFVGRVQRHGFYASLDAAREALATRTMFNVIDPETGWKADLIIRKDRGFSETEFARREVADLLGVAVPVARIEDLILAKLEWASLGASARQLEDVRALVDLGGGALDTRYLEQWVQTLGLSAMWAQLPRT